MNHVRNLIKNIPFIAKCADPERFSQRNTMIYDYEIENQGSVFAYHQRDEVNNRLAVLEIPVEYIGEPVKYQAAMDRLKIAMLSCDKAKGRITEERGKELDFLVSTSVPDEEIDSAMSLEASTQGVWNS